MNLKQLRQKHGITQESLARELGVSRPTYIHIERGEKELTVSQYAILAQKESASHNKISGKIVSHKLHDAKFKEILLYILEKVGAKPHIGETALYKLLYFIDFDFFEKYGRSLTGATYMKNHHGPTPKSFQFITDAMQSAGELERIKSKYFQYDQKKYLPLRKANLDGFSAKEKEHIDGVLARLSDKNGSELRSYSHGDVPWLATENQHDIEYHLVFQRTHPYSQRDHEIDFLEAAGTDIVQHLSPLTQEEYDYYQSLSDTS